MEWRDERRSRFACAASRRGRRRRRRRSRRLGALTGEATCGEIASAHETIARALPATPVCDAGHDATPHTRGGLCARPPHRAHTLHENEVSKRAEQVGCERVSDQVCTSECVHVEVCTLRASRDSSGRALECRAGVRERDTRAAHECHLSCDSRLVRIGAVGGRAAECSSEKQQLVSSGASVLVRACVLPTLKWPVTRERHTTHIRTPKLQSGHSHILLKPACTQLVKALLTRLRC